MELKNLTKQEKMDLLKALKEETKADRDAEKTARKNAQERMAALHTEYTTFRKGFDTDAINDLRDQVNALVKLAGDAGFDISLTVRDRIKGTTTQLFTFPKNAVRATSNYSGTREKTGAAAMYRNLKAEGKNGKDIRAAFDAAGFTVNQFNSARYVNGDRGRN